MTGPAPTVDNPTQQAPVQVDDTGDHDRFAHYCRKADIVREGTRLGVDYAQTVSCYQADAQGHACGECDSCRLRSEGFRAAGIADPTRYR